MVTYEVIGGTPLKGKIKTAGNKNSILKLIPACLLTDETITFTNVPRIRDVRIMARIIRKLGARVRFENRGTKLTINCSKVNSYEIPAKEAKMLRASNMFLGPLLSRFGKAKTVFPGGDKIGPREMTAHFVGLGDLGASVTVQDRENITLEGNLRSGDVYLYEPSVTATENAILASVLQKGSTKIINAACEPHTRDLCIFLNKLGAKIKGAGSNILEINGVNSLSGGSHRIIPDHIDAGTLIILAAVTRGEVEITDVPLGDMKTILWFFEQLGVKVEKSENSVFVPKKQVLRVKDPQWARIKGVYSQPWYSFPTDLMSLTIVLATQIKGSVLFFEKLHPGRMFFANYLNGMGANIILCDPHRIVVNGPTKLNGTVLQCPDLRAGMAFLVASLASEGKSLIQRGEIIERGYEDIDVKYRSLGAKIKKV